MCSSPKGRTTVRTTTCSTLADGMGYAEYAAMIRRSNAGIARREAQQARLKSQMTHHLNSPPSRVKVKRAMSSKPSLFTELQRMLSSLFWR